MKFKLQPNIIAKIFVIIGLFIVLYFMFLAILTPNNEEKDSKHVAVKTLQAELEQANEKIKKLEQQLKQRPNDMDKASFNVDFRKINAFSIERSVRDHLPVTIIGHWVDGKVDQWYLYCSLSEHEKLVKDFEAHKR